MDSTDSKSKALAAYREWPGEPASSVSQIMKVSFLAGYEAALESITTSSESPTGGSPNEGEPLPKEGALICYYYVIQMHLPTDEHVNVGVVVVDEEGTSVRLLSDWSRAAAFCGHDPNGIYERFKEFEENAQSLTKERMDHLSATWYMGSQITPARGSLGTRHWTLTMMAKHFLGETLPEDPDLALQAGSADPPNANSAEEPTSYPSEAESGLREAQP